MTKYLSLFILALLLISCDSKSRLVGDWEEVNNKRETISFHEDGRMEIKQIGEEGETPINFKYEIIETKDDYITFDVSLFKDTTFLKKSLSKATFKGDDKMKIENLDFPETKSNTYLRK